jgi:orotate phosphoribosyltransferase
VSLLDDMLTTGNTALAAMAAPRAGGVELLRGRLMGCGSSSTSPT